MTTRHRTRLVAAATGLLLGMTLGACTGDPQEPRGDLEPDRSVAPNPRALTQTDGMFHGLYVGRARGSGLLLAVSAPPPGEGGNREVSLFVSDGIGVFESFAATGARNRFTLRSDSADARATGEITAAHVTGSLRLRSGPTLDFRLARATGAAGLYELDVARDGQLSGASPVGIGATGTAPRPPGKGHLDLADGRRLGFRVTQAPQRALPDRQAWVIVLPDGRIAGMVPAARSALRS